MRFSRCPARPLKIVWPVFCGNLSDFGDCSLATQPLHGLPQTLLRQAVRAYEIEITPAKYEQMQNRRHVP